ncbi:MAG: type II secretion system protein [Chthoniobacterales bacterium]
MPSKDIGARAFTLIETIVVVAIIGITTALATAAWQHTQTAAQATQCLANLRSIGVAAANFSVEHDGLLPPSTHQGPAEAWQYVLRPYLEGRDKDVFKSPLAPNPRQSFSYAINDFLTRNPYGAPGLNMARRQNVGTPSQTLFFTLMTAAYGPSDHFHFASAEDGGYSPSGFQWQVQTDVANGRGHYLYVDGHASAIPWDQIKTELRRPGSTFIDPRGIDH